MHIIRPSSNAVDFVRAWLTRHIRPQAQDQRNNKCRDSFDYSMSFMPIRYVCYIVQCSYSWLINRPYVTEWMRKMFFFSFVVNRIRTLFGIVEWRLFVSMATASNSRMSKNNSFTNVTNFWFLCAGGWWWLFETWKSFVTSYFAEILFEEWE